jgi:hypothetical protein
VSNAVALGWPSGTDTGWPSEPRNMLPGRIEGYPQGSQRSANTAERLLSQAVGWWDAAAYRNGDRLLRNRGVAGELLDLQLGSSDRVATTNDPLFFAPEDQGYVYMAKASGQGNLLRIPDENALDITGDIDLRILLKLDSYALGSGISIGLFSKSSTGNRSYGAFINPSGFLSFRYSQDGGPFSNAGATAATGIPNGAKAWIRITLDADDGSGNAAVSFFRSFDGTAWTQIGTTVAIVGTVSMFAGTADLFFGSFEGGNEAIGNFYAAQVWNGIEGSGGTKVLDVDCDAITDGSATSFQAVTGQTMPINRTTAGPKNVAVPRRSGGGRSLFLLGTDDYFECVGNWQHQLLNFEQQDSFTVVAVVRQWSTLGGILFAKSVDNLTTMLGWNIQVSTPTRVPQFGDGTNRVIGESATQVSGAVSVIAGFRNVVADSAQGYVNNISAGVFKDTTAGTLANNEVVRIGRFSGSGTNYANMEFTAAAVFRRALTPAEISLITDYYQNRGY